MERRGSALYGELIYRDGLIKKISIKFENNLKSMIVGIKQFHTDVSGLLTELAEEEKPLESGSKVAFESDDDEEDSDEEREEIEAKSHHLVSEPPSKKFKTLR